MEVSQLKVLIVDHDASIRKILELKLNNLGYKTFLASNGKEALGIFNNVEPDLVILDLVLPKLDGYDVCRIMRKSSQVPIIILTTLATVSERVMGLELGADDYIIKPFSLKELEVRINSILKRNNVLQIKKKEEKKDVFQIGNLVIFLDKKQIIKNDNILNITETEFNLLEILIENIGEVLPRPVIIDNVWGYKPERAIDARIVDVYIFRLRSKIEENPNNPDLILTVRGSGYMIKKFD